MAVLAPIPRTRVAMATRERSGARASARKAKRKSLRRLMLPFLDRYGVEIDPWLRRHQEIVQHRGHPKAHEPGVVVKSPKARDQKTDERRTGAGGESPDSLPVHAAGVLVDAASTIEVVEREVSLADQEVVDDE